MDRVIKGEDSQIDELVEQRGHLNLDNLVNIKTNIKKNYQKNSNINDMPSISYNSPRYNPQNFNKPSNGYARLQMVTKNIDKEEYKPLNKMRTEAINHFGIYLNLDCVTNVKEAIDKWETTFRVAISINKMDYEMAKVFTERTLVNSVLRFWKILDET